MSEKRVTRRDELSDEEQILRDRLIVRLAPFCLEVKPSTQYCAQLVTDYVHELLAERRKRWSR